MKSTYNVLLISFLASLLITVGSTFYTFQQLHDVEELHRYLYESEAYMAHSLQRFQEFKESRSDAARLDFQHRLNKQGASLEEVEHSLDNRVFEEERYRNLREQIHVIKREVAEVIVLSRKISSQSKELEVKKINELLLDLEQRYEVELLMGTPVRLQETRDFLWLRIYLLLIASVALSFSLVFLLIRQILRPIRLAASELEEVLEGKSAVQFRKIARQLFPSLGRAVTHLLEVNTQISTFIKRLQEGDDSFTQKETRGTLPAHPAFKYLSLLQRDISAMKEREEEQEWTNESLKRFVNILKESGEDLDSLSKLVVRDLVEHMNAAIGEFYIYDKKEEQFVLLSAFAFGREKHYEKRFPNDDGLLGRVFYEQREVYLTNIPEDYFRISSGLGDAPPTCIFVLPLVLDDEVYGALEIAGFGEFPDYKLHFLKRLGENIASNIRNIQVNQQTHTLLVQAQELARELTAQEEHLRENVEKMVDAQGKMKEKELELSGQLNAIDNTLAQATYTPLGKVLGANSIFLKSLGYSEEELQRKHFFSLMPKQVAEQEEYTSFWEDLAEGNPKSGEFRMLNQQGVERWFFATFTPVLNEEEEVVKVLQLANDITEQKLKSIAYEQQTRAIHDAIEYLSLDTKGYIQEANLRFLKLMNYEIEEIKGLNLMDLSRENGQGRPSFSFYDDVWVKTKLTQRERVEVKLYNKAGEEVWIDAAFYPLRNLDNEITQILCFAYNVTKRKKLEQFTQQQVKDLRETKRKLQETIEEIETSRTEILDKSLALSGQLSAINRTLATAEFLTNGQIIKANDILLHRLGYAEAELTGKLHQRLLDAEEASNTHYVHFWNELKAGKAQVGEYKFLTSDGAEIWFRGTYSPVMDEHKEVQRIIFLGMDVTGEKIRSLNHDQQLEAISKSNAIVEYDLFGNILKANPYFLDRVGYKLEDIRGLSQKLFFRDVLEDYEHELFWNRLRNGEHIRNDFPFRTAEGTHLWLSTSFNPMQDMHGNVLKIVLFAQDITQKKELETKTIKQLAHITSVEEELRSSLDQMQTTQRTLLKQKAELRAQFQAINQTVLMASFTLDGASLEFNPQFAESFAQKEGSNFPLQNLLKAEQIAQLRRGEPLTGEYRYRSPKGQEVWLQASFSPVQDEEGKPYKILMLANDITLQKNLSLEMRSQLDAIDRAVAVIQYAPDGTILSSNQIAEDIFGYSNHQLKGEEYQKLLFETPEEKKKAASLWADLQSGEHHSSIQLRRTRTGRRVWLRSTFNPILSDNDGEPYKVLEFAQNITPIIRQQEMNRKLQHEIEQQVKAINLSTALVETQREGRITFVNDEFVSRLGHSPMDLIDLPLVELLAEEADEQHFSNAWKELLNSKTRQAVKLAFKTKSGEKKSFTLSLNPITNLDGELQKVVTFLQ